MTAQQTRITLPVAVGENRERIRVIERTPSSPEDPEFNIKLCSDVLEVDTMDEFDWMISRRLSGFTLVEFVVGVSTPSAVGDIVVTLENVTTGQPMLTTDATIAQGDKDSYANPAVVDPTNALVTMADWLLIPVATGAGIVDALGLLAIVTLQP